MDTQIAHWLHTQEQAKEQCQCFQTDRLANQLAQAPHRQNRQHPTLEQVR